VVEGTTVALNQLGTERTSFLSYRAVASPKLWYGLLLAPESTFNTLLSGLANLAGSGRADRILASLAPRAMQCGSLYAKC